MIIFNLKAVLVALAWFLVFLFFSSMERVGLGFAMAGIAGVFVSSILTDHNDFYSSSPKIFFIPTQLFSIVIFIFSLSFSREKVKHEIALKEKENQEKNEMAPYLDKLNKDVLSLSNNKYNEDTIMCAKIDSFLKLSLNAAYFPENFDYLVRNKGEKVLILVDTEYTPDIDDRFKVGIYQTIEELFKIDPYFSGKTKYMGMLEDGEFHEFIKVDKEGKSNSIYIPENLIEYYK